MSRLFIFTGKGGVGKTSVAAAHARYSANEGKKTLLVSTDMAHNLSDLFESPIGKTLVTVAPNLDALEIDPYHLMEDEYAHMKRALLDMMASSGMPIGDLAQITFFPGMDELFSLLKIMAFHESGVYDRIIVDCAPTGETLSLLKFPEMMSWYMEKFFPIGKIALRVLSPISKTLFKVKLPDKQALTDIEKLYVKLVALQTLLKDPSKTSVRLVSMPEKMVVEETKRNYMYMNLYDFNVDGLYINRILPKDIDNPFFNDWVSTQNGYVEALETVFRNMPIYKIPWFDTDLNGLEGIDQLVNNVLVGKMPFDHAVTNMGERYEKTEEGYRLFLQLPFASKEAIQFHETHLDLVLKIGNFKRCIPKPNVLRDYVLTRAKLDTGVLQVDFVKGGERNER